MTKIPLILLALVLAVASPAFSQDKTKAPAKRPHPAYTPVQDVAGQPRALLIGDSISVGYTVAVQEALKGKVNVHRPLTNCGPTTKGLEQIDEWLETGGAGKEWDVIHFNWGLHDLKYMGPDGQNLADPEAETSARQVPPAEYEANLRKLVNRLQETGATLVWRNTTPVPDGAKGRVPGDDLIYNEIATRVMADEGVATHDLYDFALERLDEIQRPADVHFSADGSRVLGKDVARVISEALAE